MSVPPLRYLLAATVLVLMTFPLHAATILPPGGTVSPLEGATVPSNINSFLIDEMSSDFFFAPGAGATFLAGSVDEAVLHDPFGLTCAGCLDFAFHITVDPASSFSVYQAVLNDFADFTVNVGYGVGTGAVIPDSAFRGGAGHSVGFFFGTSANPTLGPDEDSVYFLIATDATHFDSSGGVGINGSNGGVCNPFDINHCRSGNISGFFGPTNAPEPSSALLLGLGLAGIAALRKRLV